MPTTLKSKLAEWRAADSRARDAERSLTHLLFSRIDDPPATENLKTQVHELRQLANEKLKAAIASMKMKR